MQTTRSCPGGHSYQSLGIEIEASGHRGVEGLAWPAGCAGGKLRVSGKA